MLLHAFCSMALALLAWSFGGIESTTMAAYEAKSKQDVSFASMQVHWIVFALYLLYSLALALTVGWDYNAEPSIYTRATSSKPDCGDTTIAVIFALCDKSTKNHPQGQPILAGFVNGCLLYAVLSCANTSLYIASRTLHGLASSRRLEGRGRITRFIRMFGSTYRRTGVPFAAVCASWLVLCWVPMLGFHQTSPDKDWAVLDGVSNLHTSRGSRLSSLIRFKAKDFLFVTSSTGYVVVWAVLCIAFIRFRRWSVATTL